MMRQGNDLLSPPSDIRDHMERVSNCEDVGKLSARDKLLFTKLRHYVATLTGLFRRYRSTDVPSIIVPKVAPVPPKIQVLKTVRLRHKQTAL